MTAAIQNSFTLWFREMIAQPYQEGARRIQRAICGIDKYYVDWEQLPCLTFKERIISLAVGALLILPFINTIIWVAMRTFGHPDILSDPLPIAQRQIPPPPCSEEWALTPAEVADEKEEKTPEPEPAPERQGASENGNFEFYPTQPKTDFSGCFGITPPSPVAGEAPSKVEVYKYQDIKKGVRRDFDWTIETYSDKYVVIEKNTPETPYHHSVAKFDTQWNQRSFDWREPGIEFCVTKTDQTLVGIKTSSGKTDQQTYDLKNLPWIQGMTFGFSHLVRAKSQEIPFYMIHPTKYELREMKMVFEKIVSWNGGEALQYKSFFCSGWEKYFSGSHLFYPDGRLISAEISLFGFSVFSTKLAPSPE